MTTTDTERYVRITLLTFEGGSWISKKILYRELDKIPGLTITSLLNSRKNSLQQKRSHGEITRAQFDILYPRSGADTDVEEWDLSLLVKIIFFLFSSSLSLQEIEDLKAIRSVRNDVVCHESQPQIKENDFFVYWTKVTTSIQCLANGFGNDTRQRATDLMASLFQGPLDLQTSMDKLAQLCRNDEHMESVLAGLSRLEIQQNKMAAGIVSANTKLDDVLALLQRSQITGDDGQCKVEIPILGSKVCIVGKKEDVVKVAEDIVLKVLKSAVNKVDDPANDENVKTAVKDLLEDIEVKDAVAVSASLGSIVLSIKCFSLQGLEHILKWFKSSSNEIRLHRIEEALSEMFNEQLQVVLALPQETLDMLLVWLTEIFPARDDPTFKREISMGIQCQSADAALQVLQYLHSGDLTNRLNQLSEALSEAVNDKVKVEMEVDVEAFHRALTSISTTGTASEDRPSAQDEERIKTDIAGHDGPNTREAELSGSHDKPNESPKSKHTEQTGAEKETGPDQGGKLGGSWWPSLRGVVDIVGAAMGSAVAVGSASAPASRFGIGVATAGSIAGIAVKEMEMLKADASSYSWRIIRRRDEVVQSFTALCEDEGENNITEVCLIKIPLFQSRLIPTLGKYHAVVVFKTKHHWWSIENTSSGVIMQRSIHLSDVEGLCCGAARPQRDSITEIVREIGKTTVTELIDMLESKNQFLKPYNIVSNNCQHFSQLVFHFVANAKSA